MSAMILRSCSLAQSCHSPGRAARTRDGQALEPLSSLRCFDCRGKKQTLRHRTGAGTVEKLDIPYGSAASVQQPSESSRSFSISQVQNATDVGRRHAPDPKTGIASHSTKQEPCVCTAPPCSHNGMHVTNAKAYLQVSGPRVLAPLEQRHKRQQ